ncbi:type I-E CRISPR-associated protein Cas5/CasD [Longibacter salinarum]|uniref:Type I-E CRISPR-associated protein Cas5/CasD n=2 Tax=Longibacter salinarum TaxID=1850348 RepID=A0A2A8CUY9_9BACT|nr:type I-E CRISPR-associated protein Cas5/CasD [Longibacter salinarum]
MMDVLFLRFDAPMMSFGGPIIDNRGVIQAYPALSMITGLLGNALGVDHSEHERLQDLQERIRHAVRRDREGKRLQDYQTVDFSKPYMDDARAWTTDGRLEQRKGGSASSGTHIRERDYLAGACYTIALTLDRPSESPTLDDLADALRAPARPLFIGRKPCLPAEPLYAGRTTAEDLTAALSDPEFFPNERDDGPYAIWMEADRDDPQARPYTDRRDWQNQVHTGQRWVKEDHVEIATSA